MFCGSRRLTGRKQARKAGLRAKNEALICASDSHLSACFCDTELHSTIIHGSLLDASTSSAPTALFPVSTFLCSNGTLPAWFQPR